MKSKLFSLMFLSLFIIGMVSAACSVSILKGLTRDTLGKPIDNYYFDSNNTILVGIQVSKNILGNASNLDVSFVDALQQTVYSNALVLPANVSYVELQVNTSEQMLNGTYTISAYHNETTCTAANQISLFVYTNRTAYNSSPINIAFGLTTPLTKINDCRVVTTQGIRYDVCLNGTVPIGYDFTVGKVTALTPENASNTNYSLVIQASTPYYSYDVVNGLFQKYMDINASYDQIAKNNAQMVKVNDALVNITAQQVEDRYNNLLRQYTDSQKELQNQKSASYWMGIFIGVFFGLFLGAIILFLYLKYRAGKAVV